MNKINSIITLRHFEKDEPLIIYSPEIADNVSLQMVNTIADISAYVYDDESFYDLDREITYGSNSYVINRKPSRRLTLIWTIVNTIGPLMVIVLCIYNNHLQKESQRLSKQALKEIDEYYKTISKAFDAQTKFNDSTVDNIERHEEAMRIIVNYIKAGENNV